jgi:hypothetical protein
LLFIAPGFVEGEKVTNRIFRNFHNSQRRRWWRYFSI